MMHGPGRFGDMLNRDTLKPRALSETLARLGGYFGRFWWMLILSVVFVVAATWSQVTSPELMGQATDCFLVPARSNPFGSFGPQAAASDQQAESSCWLAKDPS